MSRLAALIALSACSFRGGLEPPLGDGPPAMLGPFGAPIPVARLNTAANEDDPSLTADLLEIYFERDGDIWSASRASIADDWNDPVELLVLNSGGAETTVDVLPDGLTLYLTSDRSDTLGGNDIYMSTRESRTAGWSPPVHVVELSSAIDDSSVTMAPDQLSLYMTRDYDIHYTSRDSAAMPWPAPLPVQGLATPAGEYAQWVDPSETVVFVTSDLGNTAGSDDIQVATRADRSSAFGPLVRLSELAAADADDEDPWLTPDLRLVVFSSDRPGGAGSNDLYFATR